MSLSPPSTRALPTLLALLAAILAAMALATAASAAPATGEVVLTLKKGAKSNLLRQGVKVGAQGADASSRNRRGGAVRILSLSATQIGFAKRTNVRLRGALVFASGERTAKLHGLILRVESRSAALSAKLDGKRRVFFRAGGAGLDGFSARLKGSLALTGQGARALRQALDLDLSGGRVGTAWARASLQPATPVSPAPVKPQPDPEPKGEQYPYAGECPVAAVQGNPGFGDAPGAVDGITAAPTFASGTSQALTGTEIDWGFKNSFRFYVEVISGGSLQALSGSVAHPTATMGMAGSYWEFPTSAGSYEPGSQPDHSDDKLVAEGTGVALFCNSPHGFSVALKDPTVTIDGDESRLTLDVGENSNGVWYPYQRVDFAELDLSGIEPEITDGGNTLVWEDVPATLTEDGEIAMGGLYEAGETLDPITVRTSLNRPLLTQCTINAGIAETPTDVEFATLSLPTLTNPVTGSGGVINWGFRRSLRASVASTGSFQLLGGANEGFPGAMGGGNSPAPSGGIGKFFRFPISEYQYEAGTADPGDDRLVATSNATVGFCNPAAGNYGVVLSKPTLVIDGGESRLVANAYSYSGGFPTPAENGWLGGRVTLVALDTSGVDAVTAGSTVSWGDVPADNTAIEAGIPVAGGLVTEALSLANLSTASTASGGFDPVTAQIELPAP